MKKLRSGSRPGYFSIQIPTFINGSGSFQKQHDAAYWNPVCEAFGSNSDNDMGSEIEKIKESEYQNERGLQKPANVID